MAKQRIFVLRSQTSQEKTVFDKGRKGFIKTFLRLFVWGLLLFFIHGCARVVPPPGPAKPPPPGYPKPYKVMGKWYQPTPHAKGFVQKGKASWYGKQFHGRKTANGEIYNMYAMTAAHKTLPLGTWVRVYNLENNKEVVVRINDRGPFVRHRIIDLSYTAAKEIDIVGPGTAPVKIVALGRTPSSKAKSPAGTSRDSIDYYSGNFTIQVGAFSDRKNAERLLQSLDKTYKNVHISKYNNGFETFYRMRVGRCSTLEEATKYEEILIQNGFEDAFIIAE
ncbi:septal ring lytic transglycosylase RlpA family protein [Thermodesulfobacteriota bacterium]